MLVPEGISINLPVLSHYHPYKPILLNHGKPYQTVIQCWLQIPSLQGSPRRVKQAQTLLSLVADGRQGQCLLGVDAGCLVVIISMK